MAGDAVAIAGQSLLSQRSDRRNGTQGEYERKRYKGQYERERYEVQLILTKSNLSHALMMISDDIVSGDNA